MKHYTFDIPLWEMIKQRTSEAIESKALHSIPTEYELFTEGDITFLVRVLSTLARKDQEKHTAVLSSSLSAPKTAINPFLPYEKALYVTDISPTHVCLLNKYNVIDHHILLVTREFEDQEILLSINDFDALLTCLNTYESLGFYNGGTIAGASQRHKHVQVIPLPMHNKGKRIPIESAFSESDQTDRIIYSKRLPFHHGLIYLNENIHAKQLCDNYHALMDHFNLIGKRLPDGQNTQSAPYNLLVTKEWMFLVPRLCECYESISINSLGFAGALLVRNITQLELLKQIGPIPILSSVAYSLSQ
ncbi:MAG: phosphorylase [Desulfobacterales bacterium]|nr:phosphorylase [Desulfobacterales bacterium]